MDVLIHVSSLLRVYSSFQHDLVRLRLLAAVAALCLIVYFATRAEPMLSAVVWNCFFLGANLFQVGRVVVRRRRRVKRRRNVRRNRSPGSVPKSVGAARTARRSAVEPVCAPTK